MSNWKFRLSSCQHHENLGGAGRRGGGGSQLFSKFDFLKSLLGLSLSWGWKGDGPGGLDFLNFKIFFFFRKVFRMKIRGLEGGGGFILFYFFKIRFFLSYQCISMSARVSSTLNKFSPFNFFLFFVWKRFLITWFPKLCI
jgi:hypothetical protein